MKTVRGLSSCSYLLLLLLLTVLIPGCGGSDLDETAPILIFDGTDPNTTGRSRQLAGTVEAGAVVQVTVNTAAVVNTLQVADGRWNCSIDALAPGSNVVTILARDSTGNQSVLLLSLLYDPLSIERWVTPIPGDTVTIGGLVDPGATNFTVIVDTAATGATATVPVVNGDRWESVLSGLPAGNNVAVVKITHPDPDVAEVERSVTITRDAAPPVVTIDPVASPTNVNSQPVTGTRENDLVVIPLAPTATVEETNLNETGIWSATLNKLQPGKNPFSASVTLAGVTAVARDIIVYDNVPPLIVGTVPVDAAVNVSPSLQVQAIFSEPLLEATLDTTTFTVVCQEIPVAGTVNFVAATRTATFIPDEPLSTGACTATLTAGITDQAGNAMAEFSSSFTVN